MALVGKLASLWQGHAASKPCLDVVVQMASLLMALQSWEFNWNALNWKSIAQKFKQTICPTIRLPYLLWLEYDAPEVLKNLHLWGCGMFSSDIVESLNYLFKDHFFVLFGEGRRERHSNRTRHAPRDKSARVCGVGVCAWA